MTRAPIGLEDKSGKFHLVDYSAAVIRSSSLPALLGLDSLSKHNAIINCKSGEIWFTDNPGCDLKPKGYRVHMQMVESTEVPLLIINDLGRAHYMIKVGV